MPPEGEDDARSGGDSGVSGLGAQGPFSSSARVAVMGALLGLRKANFSELLLAVKSPKSSLNKNLGMLEDAGFVKQSLGFQLTSSGPRRFIEITPEGEDAIKSHLEMLRKVADKLLGGRARPEPTRPTADQPDD